MISAPKLLTNNINSTPRLKIKKTMPSPKWEHLVEYMPLIDLLAHRNFRFKEFRF